MQMHRGSSPYESPPSLSEVLHVILVLWEIGGMDLGINSERFGYFVECPCGFSQMGAPLENMRRFEGHDRCRHKYQFVQGKRMKTNHGNTSFQHEPGNDKFIDFRFRAILVSEGVRVRSTSNESEDIHWMIPVRYPPSPISSLEGETCSCQGASC